MPCVHTHASLTPGTPPVAGPLEWPGARRSRWPQTARHTSAAGWRPLHSWHHDSGAPPPLHTARAWRPSPPTQISPVPYVAGKGLLPSLGGAGSPRLGRICCRHAHTAVPSGRAGGRCTREAVYEAPCVSRPTITASSVSRSHVRSKRRSHTWRPAGGGGGWRDDLTGWGSKRRLPSPETRPAVQRRLSSLLGVVPRLVGVHAPAVALLRPPRGLVLHTPTRRHPPAIGGPGSGNPPRTIRPHAAILV
ncbi:MAG: hypothetical protein J3K34DRAFT_442497 [Monoraphidium minutum]|nr:MAG: hypothetical protein J3K34DRAFT_442497 [Monoraphidium minutum]